jgi:plastocyanin
VKWSGTFSSHPLTGGQDGTADPSSPIQHTATGTEATFTFPNAGTFPYYCDFHQASGMEGAVFVE